MHILLTGSTGFIGRTVQRALERAGHTVHGGVSPRRAAGQPGQVAMDFAHDTNPAVWLPRLAGIDAVVNAVGVLRDTRARPIDALHQHTPVALFDACAQAGVRRIVQISALGIANSATRYATTKRAADTHLLGLTARGDVSGVVLRPSIVFGRGGASSALFMNLARLPVVVLPGAVLQASVQPVAVHDLAEAVVALMGPALGTTGLIECSGPEAVPMAGLIASLRQQSGHGPARVLRLPEPLSRLSARLGDQVPGVPWCSETLALLGSDNTADPAALRRLLGHEATHYRRLVESAWAQAAA